MLRLPTLARRFRRSDSGLAAIEVALTAPFLALLLLGGFDLTRYIVTRGGVDKVGFSVADVTSQYEALTSDSMKTVFSVTGKSLPTYKSGDTGVTVLTSLYLDSRGVQRVRWQCYSSSTKTWTSQIGAQGAEANVDSGLLADANDNVIVSEVFLSYTPIFSVFYKSKFDIYSRSLYRPRLGNLTTAQCP